MTTSTILIVAIAITYISAYQNRVPIYESPYRDILTFLLLWLVFACMSVMMYAV